MKLVSPSTPETMAPPRPKVGFAGVGWIGRNRMAAMARGSLIEIAALADPDASMREEAAALAPDAGRAASLEEMLEMDLDAVVIATPSALHAEQAIGALDAGLAVFCQKPLGRTASETRAVVDAARRADRLLGVDFSYRHTAAMREVKHQIDAGELGHVFAIDLTFHNAYGPGKGWFYDRKLSGGGCLIDLGIHHIDLALWALGDAAVTHTTSRLFHKGKPLRTGSEDVEDYAVARLDLDTGATVNLACSWNLPAGRDAVIEATFYGTDGALAMRNVDGSYYDFVLERFDGRSRRVIVEAPDPWGGRAAAAWAEQLARDPSFDPSIESVEIVAEVIDRIYEQSV